MKTSKRILNMASEYSIHKEIVELLLDSLGEDHTLEILQMHPSEVKTTARLNLMKFSKDEITESLREEEIRYIPINGIPEAIEIVFNEQKLGSSLTYLKGMISPQGLGSMFAVHALNPQRGDHVLDMAAAPGNKTCFIGERMKNQGLLVANDISKPRLLSLRSNLNRHGISIAQITNYDANDFPLKHKFDKILLDAPCTGEGLLVSQPNRRKSRNKLDSYVLQRTQQRLIYRATRLLKPGGTLVYSTCSLNQIENEGVLEGILQKYEPDRLNFNEQQVLHSKTIPQAVRLLPNLAACDGFFIFKGVKL